MRSNVDSDGVLAISALYGGPAQPEITDPRGIIIRARQMAEDNPDKICNPGQYDNENVRTSSSAIY